MTNRWTKALFAATEPVLSKAIGAVNLPPVFIVGNIRSGSTIVYQYLTGALDFCFFSNLERYYYKTPLSAAYFFRAADKFHFSDESTFGTSPGAYSPSDGWEIFHRYFSYHFNPPATQPLLPLKKLIHQTAYLYNQPFINKNNANSLRVFELNTLFKDALFISVRRSPVANICSVQQGRKNNNIPIGTYWAIDPAVLPEKYHFKNEWEEISFQYHLVNGFLERFFQSIPTTRYIQVDYDAFCNAPAQLIAEVLKRYHFASPRHQATLPDRFNPIKQTTNIDVIAEIEIALAATRERANDWVNTTIEQYYTPNAHDTK